MKDESNINPLLNALPQKPHSGVWGDPNIYKAYSDLVKELGELIPCESIGLHISGAGSMCRAKSKMIIAKAKILDDMVKAVTLNYK